MRSLPGRPTRGPYSPVAESPRPPSAASRGGRSRRSAWRPTGAKRQRGDPGARRAAPGRHRQVKRPEGFNSRSRRARGTPAPVGGVGGVGGVHWELAPPNHREEPPGARWAADQVVVPRISLPRGSHWVLAPGTPRPSCSGTADAQPIQRPCHTQDQVKVGQPYLRLLKLF